MSFHDLLWVLSVWELLNYDGSWYNNDLSSFSCGYFNIQQQRKVHFSLSGEENRSSVSGRINVHQVNISDSGTESSESCGPRVDLKDQLGTIKKKKKKLCCCLLQACSLEKGWNTFELQEEKTKRRKRRCDRCDLWKVRQKETEMEN